MWEGGEGRRKRKGREGEGRREGERREGRVGRWEVRAGCVIEVLSMSIWRTYRLGAQTIVLQSPHESGYRSNV